MELVVEAYNFEHAKYCIENNVENLILGNELFATRISYSFNESEIQQLINNRKNTKIWIKVNKFFFEQEINRLKMYLNWLSSLEIEKVIFQDYAISEINYEMNLKLNLVYNPETLVTNYGQFPFYLENNINTVFVARELIWKELATICEHKQNMQLMIQGFGYGFIMHSRWKLIDNFIEHYDLKSLNKQYLLIKENLRKLPNIIFEDDYGTHMLTGYIINTLELINKFKALKIDYLLIDFIKLNCSLEIVNKITNIYQQAINNDEEDEKLKQMQNIVSNDLKPVICALGFYDCPKSVLHLEKEDEDGK